MAGVGTFIVHYRLPRPLREAVQNGELAKIVNDWAKAKMAPLGYKKVRHGKRMFWLKLSDLEGDDE